MWNREDLAWAAGLFEGEGCFTISNDVPACSLGSTDNDVVLRFRETIGFGAIYSFTRKDPWKDGLQWWTTNFEHTQAFVAAVWPWLGERRRARAYESLATYRERLAARARGDGTLAGVLFGKRATDLTPDEHREYRRAITRQYRTAHGLTNGH
jgi:hypothetical protein